MTYYDKSASLPAGRSGFYPGEIASTGSERVTARVPNLGGDSEIEIAHYVGPIPDEGSDIFVSFLNGLGDEIAAIFPSSAGKIEFDFFVAASNARQELKNRADYVCTGENDEVQIQAAIDAVVAGNYGYDNPSGRVVLSSGDFYLGAPFSLPEDVIETFLLVGVGKRATRLWAEFVPAPTDIAVFNTNQTNYCTVTGMTMTFNPTESIMSDFYLISTNYLYWASIRVEDVELNFVGMGDDSDVLCNGIYAYVLSINYSEIRVSGYGAKRVMAIFCDQSEISVTAGDAVESSTPWYHNQAVYMFNSRISSIEGAGLSMSDSSGLMIQGNKFETSKAALRLENPTSKASFINENTFNGLPNADPGGLIEIGVGYQIAITNNVFSDAAGSAIESIIINHFDKDEVFLGNAKIAGNTFVGSGSTDIDFSKLTVDQSYPSEIVDISSNLFETDAGYAIDVGECNWLTITSNSIFSSQPTAIRVKEVNVFTISDNAITVSEPI